MRLKTIGDHPEMPDDLESHHRISLILPFELKMNNKSELHKMLTSGADKIEKELMKNYAGKKAMPVMIKLRRLIKDIHYHPHNKSIAFLFRRLRKRSITLPIPMV